MDKNYEAYNSIENYAKENNLIFGIGSAEPFYELKPILEKTETPFTSSDLELRTNPKLIMSEAKSIICLGLSYNHKYCGAFDEELRGNMSVGAVGEDYHITLARHLKRLCEILNINEIYFTDTGNLVDRAVALRCGIGKAGKHFSIINPDIGSMFFIGYIITKLDLKKSEPLDDFNPCLNCDKCIKACPGNAISEKAFNYKKCISYLTQAKEVTKEDYELINKQIYGCDICQRVCPYNQKVTKVYDKINEYHPKINDILSMSNAEFNSCFKNTAAGWRGKKVLQRNAIIALSNMKSEKALDILLKFKEDSRPDIKELILWAIDKITNEK